MRGTDRQTKMVGHSVRQTDGLAQKRRTVTERQKEKTKRMVIT